MRIRIANAIRQAGEPFAFEQSELYEPQEYGERAVEFNEPVRVSGTYVYDGKAFTVSAKAEASLKAVCARCTKPFVEYVSFSFLERFVKGESDSVEDEAYPYSGDEIVLDKAVLDNLFLELPIAGVCREDCKGLCPVCGADRNTMDCHCILPEA